MASSQKEYSREKLFGQIYTPAFIVCKILDEVGYSSEKILGKTILDPACGDGRFLVEIVTRILKYSPKKDLEKNLEFIFGWDIDEKAVEQCRNNLNQLLPKNIKVHWNLQVKNSLSEINNQTTQKFDYVVGNPPYIRIQHLEETERKFIQKNFEFCKMGSTDIFIAFFELAKHMIGDTGICSFISPNSYFKSETGKVLRDFLSQNHIISLYDYGGIQVFENVSTYTSITTFSNKNHQNFSYYKAKKLEIFELEYKDFVQLQNTKFWQLGIKYQSNTTGIRLGDIANIFVGLATLCDKAYIFDLEEDVGEHYLVNTKFSGKILIEKSILKPIIKVSRNKKQYILFPYEKINEKHKIINEQKLKNTFPLAYQYLLGIREQLQKRSSKNDKKLLWYEFGRNQSLDTSFGKKIVFSTMNEKPNFILIEDEDSTFYSGYGIKYEGDYQELLEKLNSKEMQDFINVAGKDLRGGRKSYNKKIVEEFRF